MAPGEVVAIRADPALMKLLIRNLIDNAIKFSRPDSKPIVVRLETGTDRVVLRIIDDGIGIPAGSEERISASISAGESSSCTAVRYGWFRVSLTAPRRS